MGKTVNWDSLSNLQTEIPVVVTKTQRHGVPMVVGVITAGTLFGIHEIPRRDTRKKTGYQRDVSQTRVNSLVKDIVRKRVDLPTAVLLNLRVYESAIHLIERKGHYYFCPNGEILYVVDGQHRILSLAKLVEDDPQRWKDFTIPFVCMLGADERVEMEQFYVVNSTAKSVRTDLAFDILKQRAETDPEVMKSLQESAETWKVAGQGIAEELAKTPLWKGHVRFPVQPKVDTTIGSAGLVGSLKPLLSTPYFSSIKIENQVKILDAYWQGIRRVSPQPFDEPSKYVLQKSTGVQVMHAVLVTAIEYVRSKGLSVIEINSYEKAMKKTLLDLEGDTGSGSLVRGADFWLSGSDGAAGSFSSNAGRRVLIAKIRGMMPPVEVE